MITCPTCSTPSPAGASFCGNCGASLAGAAAAFSGNPSPQARPSGLSANDSKNWAMGAHLTALAGALVGGVASFVGPLVIWLIRREDDQFAAQHALEALNFNLMVLGVVIVGAILGIGTLGLGFLIVLPIYLLLGILWLIWSIQAAMAASRGEPYRYPVSIRLIS